jgi:hypothetical protein
MLTSFSFVGEKEDEYQAFQDEDGVVSTSASETRIPRS